jgi:hypothetical protein
LRAQRRGTAAEQRIKIAEVAEDAEEVAEEVAEDAEEVAEEVAEDVAEETAEEAAGVAEEAAEVIEVIEVSGLSAEVRGLLGSEVRGFVVINVLLRVELPAACFL